jgi:hypothetical protein
LLDGSTVVVVDVSFTQGKSNGSSLTSGNLIDRLEEYFVKLSTAQALGRCPSAGSDTRQGEASSRDGICSMRLVRGPKVWNGFIQYRSWNSRKGTVGGLQAVDGRLKGTTSPKQGGITLVLFDLATIISIDFSLMVGIIRSN